MMFTTALIAVFVAIGVQGKLTPGDIAQLKTWLVCRCWEAGLNRFDLLI